MDIDAVPEGGRFTDWEGPGIGVFTGFEGSEQRGAVGRQGSDAHAEDTPEVVQGEGADDRFDEREVKARAADVWRMGRLSEAGGVEFAGGGEEEPR